MGERIQKHKFACAQEKFLHPTISSEGSCDSSEAVGSAIPFISVQEYLGQDFNVPVSIRIGFLHSTVPSFLA